MNVTLNVTLSETDARQLWDRCALEDGSPPLGQALADWLASHCAATIESNFQFDGGVCVHAEAECTSNTEELLKELLVHDNRIDSRFDDETNPIVVQSKERRDEIKNELLLPDDPEKSEDELEELLKAYGAVIGYPQAESGEGDR